LAYEEPSPGRDVGGDCHNGCGDEHRLAPFNLSPYLRTYSEGAFEHPWERERREKATSSNKPEKKKKKKKKL
jgi:hypothetical protein